jgi:hypothetical protein
MYGVGQGLLVLLCGDVMTMYQMTGTGRETETVEDGRKMLVVTSLVILGGGEGSESIF